MDYYLRLMSESKGLLASILEILAPVSFCLSSVFQEHH